ncbi:hypothetical protein Z043_103599, partial [Scleropages formosus]
MPGGGRTSSTTTVVDSKNGDVVSSPSRAPRKTVTDDLYATFSSPMAWILVLALIITWSAVAVIMFDLLDYKGLTGNIHDMGSDPMNTVNEAQESTDWVGMMLSFVSNLLSPEDDEGDLAHAVRKKDLEQAKETKERKLREEKREAHRDRRKVRTRREEEREKKAAKPEGRRERPRKEEKVAARAKIRAKPRAERPAKAEGKGTRVAMHTRPTMVLLSRCDHLEELSLMRLVMCLTFLSSANRSSSGLETGFI